MSLYIFLLYYIYHLCFTCIDFYDLSAWGDCWFVVYIRRFICKFLNVCPFDYMAVAGSGKIGPVNQVNHTSWVAVVTPTDRPKSVHNRSVIELLCGVVLSLCPYDISVSVWAFVIGLSQISSFFSSDWTIREIWPLFYLINYVAVPRELFAIRLSVSNITNTVELFEGIPDKSHRYRWFAVFINISGWLST